MNNVPVYTQYNDETKIALLDNSSIAFLEKMERYGRCTKVFLREYDVILLPKWVMEEVDDSRYRRRYIQGLHEEGIPIYIIQEENYADLANGEEGNLYKIVYAAVSSLGILKSYMRRYVEKEDILDMEEYLEWIKKLYQDWPLSEAVAEKGRIRKKNAGEISLVILAEIISWYFPEIEFITIYTQDRDTYAFQQNAHELLKEVFQDRKPAGISFKSNDVLIYQMYSELGISLEEVKEIRKDVRSIIFTKQYLDGSTVLDRQKYDNDRFIELMQDKSVRIIF